MDSVKSQYESYPYPARNPADEAKRLIQGSPSAVAEIDHYLYGGARDWSGPFRVLVAGGGTGDGLIMLAQQLSDLGCPADITYIDLSTASRAIAAARAEKRGLNNITFHTGSLLNAASMGPFDYIDCVGVLHHLPEPSEGFAALRAALAPDGGMGLMVYGALGRTGVYDMQDMLRVLTKKDHSPEREVETAQALLSALPDSNRFKRNPFLSDHQSNPAGLYDLLLHKQDRAYTVPQLYEELDRADLGLISFVGRCNYDPLCLLTDAKLKARISQLSEREQHAFAELFTGNLSKHTFYAASRTHAETIQLPEPQPQAIPLANHADLAGLAKVLRSGKALKGRNEGLAIDIILPPLTANILERVDGKVTFEDIHNAITPRAPADTFYQQVREIYRVLFGLNMLLLRVA